MIKFNSIHLFICSFFFIVLFSSCSHDSIDTSVSRLKDTDVVELTQTPETNFTVSNGTLSKYLKLFYKGKAIDKVDFLLRAKDHYIGEAGTTMDYEQVFLTWTPRLNFYGTYSGIYQWAHHFTKK